MADLEKLKRVQTELDKVSSEIKTLQNQINNIKTSYLPLTGGTVTGDLRVH